MQLLLAGADPDIPDHDGHTPLMVASRAGYVETARELIAYGANSELRDNQKRTALWYAVKHEQRAVAALLRIARQGGDRAPRPATAPKPATRAKAS